MDTIDPLQCLIDAGLLTEEQAAAIHLVPYNYAPAVTAAMVGLIYEESNANNNPVPQSGTLTSAGAISVEVTQGRRYALIVGYTGDDFNSQTIGVSHSNGTSVSPLPVPGAYITDYVAFDEPGSIEFVAAETQIKLVPSGAVTSVNYTLVAIV